MGATLGHEHFRPLRDERVRIVILAGTDRILSSGGMVFRRFVRIVAVATVRTGKSLASQKIRYSMPDD
jgi:hypothetical protein